MVQEIYEFLTAFIGDVSFTNAEGSLTLMKLVSYILTLCIFGFMLFPIFSIFRNKRKGD